MAYATIDDITDLYGAEALIAADRDGDGTAEADVVARALVSASEEIDSYLSVRYVLPLAGTHGVLVQYCVDIALYRLSNSRGFVTDELRQRYEDARAALKDLAAGRAALVMPRAPAAGEDDPLAGAGPQPMLSHGPERLFSRDKMREL